MTKPLGQTIGDNHRIDETMGEEIIDAKILEPEMKVEIGVDQEEIFTPRRDDRRYQSPNSNSGTRNRSTSRVTMNTGRVRCYKYNKYDHFANECPNSVTDDSDGYESDRAALQLITTNVEIHQNSEGTNQLKSKTIKLIKGKNVTASFLPLTKKSGPVIHDKSFRYIPDKEQRHLTEDQARPVYRKVETDKVINIETIKQETEDNKITRYLMKKTQLRQVPTKW